LNHNNKIKTAKLISYFDLHEQKNICISRKLDLCYVNRDELCGPSLQKKKKIIKIEHSKGSEKITLSISTSFTINA